MMMANVRVERGRNTASEHSGDYRGNITGRDSKYLELFVSTPVLIFLPRSGPI